MGNILLDTNVVSELTREVPNAEVLAWFAAQRSQGRAISTEDVQIATIALVHGVPLATRNVKDFVGITGLTVVNPWAAANGGGDFGFIRMKSTSRADLMGISSY